MSCFPTDLFVPCARSRPSPAGPLLFNSAIYFLFHAHILLFGETYFFVFGLVRHLSRAPFRLILPLAFFCLNRSPSFPNNKMWMKPHGLSFVLLIFSIVFPGPVLNLHEPCRCSSQFKMAFWSWFMAKYRLPGPERASVSATQSREVIPYASRSPQLKWCFGKTSGKQYLRGEWQLLSARVFGQDFLKEEVCELVPPSSSSSVGFHDHLLPVSVAVMLFLRLVLVRLSVLWPHPV